MLGYLLLILVFVWILMGRTQEMFYKVAASLVIIGLLLLFLTTQGGLDGYELMDLLFSF